LIITRFHSPNFN